MWEIPDKGLKVEIIMYKESIDSIIPADSSLTHLSMLYKISWKAFSRPILWFITVFVVELK